MVTNIRSSQGPSSVKATWGLVLWTRAEQAGKIKHRQAVRSADPGGSRARSGSHLPPPTTASVCQKSLWLSTSDWPEPGQRAIRCRVAAVCMSKRGQSAATHLRAGAGVALQPGVILSARAAALRRLQERGKRPVKRQRAWCLEQGETQARLSEMGTSPCKEQAENASNKFSYLSHERCSHHINSAVHTCHTAQHPA